MTDHRRPCIFFDRDGIINPNDLYYITDPDDFEVFPAFIESLRIVTDAGYPAVVITNQKCVGLGQLSVDGLAQIHGKLRRILAGHGLSLLDIYYCPDTTETSDKKPNPGMLLAAAARHQLDLSRSWMIGDSPRDVVAGKRAGCRTVLVAENPVPEADIHLTGIDALPAWLAAEIS